MQRRAQESPQGTEVQWRQGSCRSFSYGLERSVAQAFGKLCELFKTELPTRSSHLLARCNEAQWMFLSTAITICFIWLMKCLLISKISIQPKSKLLNLKKQTFCTMYVPLPWNQGKWESFLGSLHADSDDCQCLLKPWGLRLRGWHRGTTRTPQAFGVIRGRLSSSHENF
jgi:hypothetical protein